MRNLLIVAATLVLSSCHQVALVAPPSFNGPQDEDQQLLSILRAREFAKLDATLQAIQRGYEADPLTESQADIAWGVFSRTGAGLGPLLDEWVAKTPGSYAARLARGSHLMHMGYSARGSRFSSQTSAEQFKGMAQYHAAAIEDLDAALATNPRAVHAVIFRMELAKAAGRRDEVRKFYEQALKLNPLSFTGRNWYLGSLQPRWGGSYEAMEAEIVGARPLHEKNPRLKVLEGAILTDRAQIAINAKRYHEVNWMTSNALAHGAHSTTLRYRAEGLVATSQMALAKKDLDAVLAIDPQGHRTHYLLGYIHMQQRNMRAAIDEFTAELELDGDNHKVLDTRGAAHASMGDLKTALVDFERALALDPGNQEYQADVSRARQLMTQGR